VFFGGIVTSCRTSGVNHLSFALGGNANSSYATAAADIQNVAHRLLTRTTKLASNVPVEDVPNLVVVHVDSTRDVDSRNYSTRALVLLLTSLSLLSAASPSSSFVL
jgi:hypothetical protein